MVNIVYINIILPFYMRILYLLLKKKKNYYILELYI